MMLQSTQLCDFVVPPGLPCVAFCEAGPSTTVERPLQINSFMQNKANFPDAQMNVTKVLTKEYEKWTLGGCGKNKANSKPIKANFQKVRMNVNFYSTKDYENIPNLTLFENKPNTKPIQTQTKPKQTQYKPKQTQFQFSTMLNCVICSAAFSTDKPLQQPMFHNF